MNTYKLEIKSPELGRSYYRHITCSENNLLLELDNKFIKVYVIDEINKSSLINTKDIHSITKVSK